MHLKAFIAAATLFVASTQAVAFDAKSEFTAAYKAYQTAVEDGDYNNLRSLAKESYDLGFALYGKDHLTTAILSVNHAQQQYPAHKNADVLQQALLVYEREYGATGKELIDVLMELGAASTESRDRSDPKHYHDRALSIAKMHFGADSFVVADLSLEIGRTLLTNRYSPYTYHYLKDAQKIFENLGSVEAEAKLAETYFWVGKYKLAKSQNKAATDSLLQSLTLLEKLAPDAPLTMTTHAFLIEAFEKRGMREEATKHCLAIGKATPIKNDQNYMPVYRTRPTYPITALNKGREGYAIVSLTVDTQGFIQNAHVTETEGDDAFAQAALEAANTFRYVPRFEDGAPVETQDVKYKFIFTIAD